MDDVARARSALQALDPGCDRAEWVRIGMAAKAANLSLDDFTEWSAGASNFASNRDCAQAWHSFKDGGITAATLYHEAYKAGWEDPARSRQNALRRVQTVRKGPKSSSFAHTPQRPFTPPESVWEACQAATDVHPYIVAKRGRAEGLRVVPDTSDMAVAGQQVSGWLVVPVRSLTGELRTVQLIPSPGTGKKLNLPGAEFHDGLFVVGDPIESTRIFIVEGIGQAWACWSATGGAAVVSFGAGRMALVANITRRAHPDGSIVVVPDRGKEAQAESIARQIRGRWVAMPPDKPANYDANDYAGEYGADELAELLGKPQTPTYRYRLLAAGDLLHGPPMSWLLRGVLPAQGLACVYGASGSGKSFLALDLGTAVADGRTWFGCRATRAAVVYVALEGEAGFRQRVQAWQQHHGREVPATLKFVMQAFDLRDPCDLKELCEAVAASGCGGGLLVLDTLNRAAAGADENSSADMGQLIAAAKELQARLGGMVLLVHHSGKDETKGLRGHSSLFAALDGAIEVKRTLDRRDWRIAKSKDDGDAATHPFRLDVVEVGRHDDGDPITSCVVVPDEAAASRPQFQQPSGPIQKLVYEALGEPLRKSQHFGKAAAPPGRPCVDLEAVLPLVGEKLTCRPDQRLYQARRAITSMTAKGVLQTGGGWLWLP